jgi:hypothetical protein
MRKFLIRGIQFSFYLTVFRVARIYIQKVCAALEYTLNLITQVSFVRTQKLRAVAMLLFFIFLRHFCNKICTTSEGVADIPHKYFRLYVEKC